MPTQKPLPILLEKYLLPSEAFINCINIDINPTGLIFS